MHKKSIFRLLVFLGWFCTGIISSGHAQQRDHLLPEPLYSLHDRMRDSAMAMKVPLLSFPETYRNRSLPYRVDNSESEYWPGIRYQYNFYSCQQHCGVGYLFTYEINRRRQQPGWYWENTYPTHYTWNFMNYGERYQGVNFLQSFEIIRKQGHMTSDQYGNDTSLSYLGWISGYDRYYRGMFNRLKGVNAIRVNGAEGIQQLKSFLYDRMEGRTPGGIACFTTSSYTLLNMPQLPSGTPEEGKSVVLSWVPSPTHGLTIVGYNDSIRYDINGDGKYTNHLDINGDGIADARDWEFGAFRVANSYGNWWEDEGFVWAMYSSFAKSFPDGGIWNNRVYTVDPDTGYAPVLTARVKVSHNVRHLIRIMAGVSQDTNNQFPRFVEEIPFMNFQGGAHFMQGEDADPAGKSIEFGIDLTSLLKYVDPGKPARYFVMLEEQDPENQGSGSLGPVTFFHHMASQSVAAKPGEVSIRDSDITIISAVADFTPCDLKITTAQLPPVNPGEVYRVKPEAEGGTPPYTWSLDEPWMTAPADLPMPAITTLSIFTSQDYIYHHAVALPFSFPFHGKEYDTVWVNDFGFICLEPQALPEPYLTAEMSMLRSFPVIAPAFMSHYEVNLFNGNGIWVNKKPDCTEIRWKLSVAPYYSSSHADFSLILYPDGRFAFRYGEMNYPAGLSHIYSGVSKGDDQRHQLQFHADGGDLSGRTLIFFPQILPEGIRITADGWLELDEPDPFRSYEITLRATDARRMETSRTYDLTGSLTFQLSLSDTSQNTLIPGREAAFTLNISNRGTVEAGPAKVTLCSNDSRIVLMDSIVFSGPVPPGESQNFEDAFTLLPEKGLPDGFPVILLLEAEHGDTTWSMTRYFMISAPAISLLQHEIRDGDNHMADPGEVADLVIPVRNMGWSDATALQLELIPQTGNLSVISDPVSRIDHLLPASSGMFSFRLKISKEVPPGTNDTLRCLLSDSSGLLLEKKLPLLLGKKPVAVISLSSSRVSARAMKTALDSIGAGFDTLFALPSDILQYETVFLILGTAGQGNHTLTIDKAASLSRYLESGGNLYMESYTSWYYVNKTPLHPFFKYTTMKVPVWFYPAAIGTAGTLGDGMGFDYSGAISYAIFDLQPVEPALSTFTNTDSVPKSLQVAYRGEDYRTIATLLEFSSLTGTSPYSTRQELMQRYLDFFGVNFKGPFALFHADRDRVCAGGSIGFSDDSFEGITERIWVFPGGEPSVCHEPNPVVTYPNPGIYDVKLTIANGERSDSLIKKGYITVESCAGVEGKIAESGLRIWPNPATDEVFLKTGDATEKHVTVRIADLTGRVVKIFKEVKPEPGMVFRISVKDLHPGLYLLQAEGAGSPLTGKLMVR